MRKPHQQNSCHPSTTQFVQLDIWDNEDAHPEDHTYRDHYDGEDADTLSLLGPCEAPNSCHGKHKSYSSQKDAERMASPKDVRWRFSLKRPDLDKMWVGGPNNRIDPAIIRHAFAKISRAWRGGVYYGLKDVDRRLNERVSLCLDFLFPCFVHPVVDEKEGCKERNNCFNNWLVKVVKTNSCFIPADTCNTSAPRKAALPACTIPC